MSSTSVIEGMVKLGTVISDAASKKVNGKFNFVDFLKSEAPVDIKNAVNDLIKELKPDVIDRAIKDVEKKQVDLLAGKALTDLSTDKLVQYATLTDTKLLLRTAKIKRAIKGDFFAWLQSDGLSGIIKIAKIAIPLLV
jgi:hypothetical protein